MIPSFKKAPFHRIFLSLFLAVAGAAASVGAQNFSDYFTDSTLRLDYVLAGNSRQQAAFLHDVKQQQGWAGRRNHLSDIPLRGNGQLLVRHHASQRLIYTHTFSTLFQEWLTTEEATRVSRSFEAVFLVPFPKDTIDISLTLFDTAGNVATQLCHTLPPSDLLIRQAARSIVEWRPILQSGSTDSCVDIALVAEGYTPDEMGKFYADAERAARALMSHKPFSEMTERFNIIAVATPSQMSGPSVPHAHRWGETAVGSHFDTFYSERYLTTSRLFRLYDWLSGLPAEHVIVLANTSTYGGGGIYNQLTITATDHPTFEAVLVHEFGHEYAGLADEYFYDDEYAHQYNDAAEPWEPNITTLVDFSSKWADMLPAQTPIPTPPAQIPDYRHLSSKAERDALNAATQRLGVFEGGGYQSKGVFRPAQECRMKINEAAYFCPVCTRAIQRTTDFLTR